MVVISGRYMVLYRDKGWLRSWDERCYVVVFINLSSLIDSE